MLSFSLNIKGLLNTQHFLFCSSHATQRGVISAGRACSKRPVQDLPDNARRSQLLVFKEGGWAKRTPSRPHSRSAILSVDSGRLYCRAHEKSQSYRPKVGVTKRTKSQRYSRAEPQNPNRIARKGPRMGFRRFYRKPPKSLLEST